MPCNEWNKANNRAKYGPVRRYEKRRWKTRSRCKRIPPNFRKRLDFLFIIYAGTPAKVIHPNGDVTEIRTSKNLRFGSEATDHRSEGCHTFKRFGFCLVVRSELVEREHP